MRRKTEATGETTESGLQRLKPSSTIPVAGLVDREHSDDEDRFIAIGMSSAARLLVAVHCDRQSNSVIRIISARAATKRETRFYEEGI